MPILDMTASGASVSSGSASLTSKLALSASGSSLSSGSADLRVATGTRVTQAGAQADSKTDMLRVTQAGAQADSKTDVLRVTQFALQVDGQKRTPQNVTQFTAQAEASTDLLQVTQFGLQIDGRFTRSQTTVNCWEFHVTDRWGNYLAYLDGAYDKAYLAQLNEVGSGSFKIHARDPKATAQNLAVGNVVLVRYRNVDVGAFVIEEVREELIGESEAQGEVITVSGRGLLALLEKGIVYPTDLNDKSTWERKFTAQTPAAIFLTLHREYEARGGGELTPDFTAAHDSRGEAWTSTVTVNYRAGQSLLEVVRNHAGFGVDVTVDPDRTLHYWNSAGEDKSDRIFFRQGLNLLSCARTRDAKVMANVVLGEGQDVLVESTSGGSISTYGRKEAYLSAGNTSSSAQVAQINQLFLDRYAGPVESLQLSVTSDLDFPLLSYGLGDTVRVEVPGHVSGAYRILSVSIREKDSPCDLQVDLEVASLRLDYLVRLQRVLEAQRSLNAAGAVSGLAATDTRPISTEGHTHVEADITNLGATVVKDGDAAGGDLSGTYPNPTVAKLQGRAVSNAAPSDGQVLTWNAAGSQWEPRAPSGGGGGYTYTHWDPNAPPVSAHAADDEFNDSTLDAKWSTFNPGNTTLNISEGNGFLRMLQATHAGNAIAGIYQSVPTGDWAAILRVSNQSKRANYATMGLMIGQDLAGSPSTTPLVVFSLTYNNSGLNIEAANIPSYNGTWSLFGNSADAQVETGIYLRFRKIGSTIYADYSTDGIGWVQIGSTTPAWTPGHFGIFINNVNTGADSVLLADFFRVDTDTSLYRILQGRLIS